MQVLWALFSVILFTSPSILAHTLVHVVAEGDEPVEIAELVSPLQVQISQRTLVRVDPDRAPEWNGGEIAYALKRLREPTLIVAQGKAAADTLEVLLTNPVGVEQVKHFITFRGWIGGYTREDSNLVPPTLSGGERSPLNWLPRTLSEDLRDLYEVVLHSWDPQRQHKLALSSAHRQMRLRHQAKALRNLGSQMQLTAIGSQPEHQIPEQPLLPEPRVSVSL